MGLLDSPVKLLHGKHQAPISNSERSPERQTPKASVIHDPFWSASRGICRAWDWESLLGLGAWGMGFRVRFNP